MHLQPRASVVEREGCLGVDVRRFHDLQVEDRRDGRQITLVGVANEDWRRALVCSSSSIGDRVGTHRRAGPNVPNRMPAVKRMADRALDRSIYILIHLKP